MAAKKTAKKTTASAPAKTEDAPVAKKAAKKAVKKAAPAKTATKVAKSPAAKPVQPDAPKTTPEMIARAAYLNYRRRVENGLPGDSHGDWIEAELQLAKSGGR